MRVSLYIENKSIGELEKVDLFEDETISIKDRIRDRKAIDKIFSTFSQSFKLPASKNNNRIFKHYYNSQITNGFDARFKAIAEIRIDGGLYKNGSIVLTKVKLKDEQVFSYDVTFYDDITTLKDKFGKDKLKNLNEHWNRYNANTSFDYMRKGFFNGYNSEGVEVFPADHGDYNAADGQADLIVPFISAKNAYVHLPTEDEVFNVNQEESLDDIQYRNVSSSNGILYYDLKFANRVGSIVDAIEDRYGINFSDDFFNIENPEYNSLFLWLSNKKGQMLETLELDGTPDIFIGTSVDSFLNAGSTAYSAIFNDLRFGNNKNRLQDEDRDHTIDKVFGKTEVFRKTLHSIALEVYPLLEGTSNEDTASVYDVVIVNNRTGQILGKETNLIGNRTIANLNTVQLLIDVDNKDTVEPEEIEPVIRIQSNTGLKEVGVKLIGISKYELNKSQYEDWGGIGFPNFATAFSNSSYSGIKYATLKQGTGLLQQQIPDMTILEFLSSIFQLFNLVAYVDDESTKYIKYSKYIYELDSDSSTSYSYDITYKNKFNKTINFTTTVSTDGNKSLTLDAKEGSISITPTNGGSVVSVIQKDPKINTVPLVKVLPYSSYINRGETLNIDEFIDIKEIEVEPSKLYSDIEFKFLEPKTNNILVANTNRDTNFGDLKVDSSNFGEDQAFRGGTYKVTPKFSKMQFEKPERLVNVVINNSEEEVVKNGPQWGWAVDRDFKPTNVKNLLFYGVQDYFGDAAIDDGIQYKIYSGVDDNYSQRVKGKNGGYYEIVEEENYFFSGLSKHWRPSNSLTLRSDTSTSPTINFGTEFDEYLRPSGSNTDPVYLGIPVSNNQSLFNRYYDDYISTIYDSGTRIIKLSGYIDTSFIRKVNTGSTIIYQGNLFTIEEINIDLVTGKAKVTLMSKLEISNLETANYSITPNNTNVDEGDTVVWTINTSNIASGTALYWTNNGDTNGSDFTDGTNSGQVTVFSNTATITKTISSDSITEGSENIILQLRVGGTSGDIVATANTVTVNDTSTAATPTYSVSPTSTNVDEGDTVNFNVTTTNVSNGTVLYWTNDGTTTGADFNGGLNNGTVTINSNQGTITRTLVNDTTSEGSETIIVKLRTGSVSGTVVATAATVTVNDTSTTPSVTCYTYSLDNNTPSMLSYSYTTCNGGAGGGVVPDGVTTVVCAQQGTVTFNGITTQLGTCT